MTLHLLIPSDKKFTKAIMYPTFFYIKIFFYQSFHSYFKLIQKINFHEVVRHPFALDQKCIISNFFLFLIHIAQESVV